MKKYFYFFLLFISFATVPHVYALDPVAPKEERKFGTVEVKSPNSDDICTLTPIAATSSELEHATKFKPNETIKVPVGEYKLNVNIQGYVFKSDISVQPTERSYIVVTGYGNLKVTSPNPEKDKVTILNAKGETVKTSNTGSNITLPIGVYQVLIKVGASEVKQKDVRIVTNTVREIEVGK